MLITGKADVMVLSNTQGGYYDVWP